MGLHIRQWFEDRWPLSSLVRSFLHERINGGARFAYVFGSSTFFLFLLQVVTGVWQMFYYVPTVDHAYDSVSYLRLQVPFGWLIHGLHYWGANAFIVVMGCHAIRVFVWGAYKRPRELTWLLGVALLALGASFIFTGAVLPWDNMGYWAGEVGTSIAGTVPWAGEFLKLLIRGGPTMDQLALARMFVFHVAILPGLAAVVMVAHLAAFRMFGSAGPWSRQAPRRIGWFWPSQVLKDTIVISALLVVLVTLAACAPAPFAGPADPLDSSYTPKPEWNFLFLYQGLKAFKGVWEPVGTVGIPAMIFLLLIALPFLDRREERKPTRRPVVMALGFVFVTTILTLTVTGYYSTPGLSPETVPPSGPQTPPAASALAPSAKDADARTRGQAANVSTSTTAASTRSVHEGMELFASNGCAACHTVAGKSNLLGPSLQDEAKAGRSTPWLRTQILNPRLNYPNSIMPAYSSLTPAQADNLIDYLMSLSSEAAPAATQPGAATMPAIQPPAPMTPGGPVESLPLPGRQGPPGPAARMIGNPDLGRYLYGQFCMRCHGEDGAGGVPNPMSTAGKVPPLRAINRAFFSDDPLDFAQKVDPYVQYGSRTPGPDPAMDMLAFGSTHTLTQQQIANLEAYILQINGVDRSRIIHPGMTPPHFALLTIAVFAAAGAGLAAVWWISKRRTARRNPPA